MNLFFYIVNTNSMKKMILFFLFFISINTIYAIEDIEIDSEYLVPRFNKNINVYNYFTSNNSIKVNVKKTNNEIIYGDSIYKLDNDKTTIEIRSSNNEKYIINVFKNYKKSNDKGYLEYLDVKGYDINFDNKIHEYYININDDKYLNIDYVLSNDNVLFSISGNGNFNKHDNIIKITANDEEYIIHALKTINVSFIENDKVEEMSNQKKEIVIFILITISCLLIILYYYSLFIFN